jgi:steroid delta-isomerase-like uncharacterized protein
MEPQSVVKKYVDTWCRRDLEAWIETFATDGVVREPGSEEQPVPKEKLKDYLKGLEAILVGFPDAKWETVSLNAISEKLAVWQWIFRGTNTGAFEGHPPTQRKVVLHGCEILEIANGKIRSVQAYYDLLSFQKQLGR